MSVGEKVNYEIPLLPRKMKDFFIRYENFYVANI